MRALRLSIGGRRWLAPVGGVYIAAVLSTNYYTFIQGVRRPRAGQRRDTQTGGWLSPSAGIHLFYTAIAHYVALLTTPN